MKDQQPIDSIAETTHLCHQQLHETRQNILAITELVRQTSSAYYTMCDLSNELTPAGGSELLTALAEFRRRGILQFSDKSVEALSNDYTQSLKLLKQAVDKAVTICDRLVMLNAAGRAATSEAEKPPAPKPQPVFQSLDEALEAELNAEE
jgi:hypothetical protein